ncbi:hypothetical protein GRS96_01540 [Rathayibacter sp. VKM Ac-2803]|uniref:hypothetical protein n=1 Tax=Rathayibacter sp. VKM Ac-2803 TaxID=2609256 RepID=UPI001358B889|nr:hypothetical protein [Rathayibacter sp. VKM Ac-2803]MWV47954.1 hypothetical protein [Rathayibacter sp. VKM Ac-2803]
MAFADGPAAALPLLTAKTSPGTPASRPWLDGAPGDELDEHMRTLLPLAEHERWSITGAGSTNDGPTDGLTIALDRGPQAGRCSIRTMLRTGLRIGPRSSVHGQVTDAVATASLAVNCLLLDAVPEGLERREAIAAMDAAGMRSTALAEDRDGWSVEPLTLDGTDYALFTRAIPEGSAAHADLGWATIAMWSTGPLFPGPFRLAEVESGDDLRVR